MLGRYQQRPAQVILPPSPNNRNNSPQNRVENGMAAAMDQDDVAVVAQDNNNLAESVCFNTHNLVCRKRAGLALHRGIAIEQF